MKHTVLLLAFISAFAALAQQHSLEGIRPRDLIQSTINERPLRRIAGSVHPLARPENDVGRAPSNQVLHRMILVLKKDAAQQAALDQLTVVQQDPQSPQFHKWLTPENYGEHFGISLNDQQQLIQWLQNENFTIDDTAPARWTITFSGTAAQAEHAFHTEIHLYQTLETGTVHYANATEVQVAEALSEVVAGVLGLHDFPPTGIAPGSAPIPLGVVGNLHYLTPADFATIYNLTPLSTRAALMVAA
jgi:subtilase family serine protease